MEERERDPLLDILSALHNTRAAIFGRLNKPKEALGDMNRYLEIQRQIQASSSSKGSSKLAAAYSEVARARLACIQLEDDSLGTESIEEIPRLLSFSTTIRRNLDGFKAVDLYNALRYEGLYHLHVKQYGEAERCFSQIIKDRAIEYGRDDTKGARSVSLSKKKSSTNVSVQGRYRS